MFKQTETSQHIFQKLPNHNLKLIKQYVLGMIVYSLQDNERLRYRFYLTHLVCICFHLGPYITNNNRFNLAMRYCSFDNAHFMIVVYELHFCSWCELLTPCLHHTDFCQCEVLYAVKEPIHLCVRTRIIKDIIGLQKNQNYKGGTSFHIHYVNQFRGFQECSRVLGMFIWLNEVGFCVYEKFTLKLGVS